MGVCVVAIIVLTSQECGVVLGWGWRDDMDYIDSFVLSLVLACSSDFPIFFV